MITGVVTRWRSGSRRDGIKVVAAVSTHTPPIGIDIGRHTGSLTFAVLSNASGSHARLQATTGPSATQPPRASVL